MAGPPSCSLTPHQDTVPEAFRISALHPWEAADRPACCVAALSQTQTSTSRAQPLPTPAFQRQVHLAGCPAPPVPTPVLCLRAVLASSAARNWNPHARSMFFLRSGSMSEVPLVWARPGSLVVPWGIGAAYWLGASTRPDREGLMRALAPLSPPTPSHQSLLALCGCAPLLPPFRG